MTNVVIHHREGKIIGYTSSHISRDLDPERDVAAEIDTDTFELNHWRIVDSQLVSKSPEEIRLEILRVLRNRKLYEMKDFRKRYLFSGITYKEKKIFTDAESVGIYHMYLQEYNAGFYPETDGVFETPVAIKLPEGHSFLMLTTVTELKEFLIFVNTHIKTVWASYWEYKQRVQEATTNEEVLNLFQEYLDLHLHISISDYTYSHFPTRGK